jgi:phosphatidylserine/phosphatidylglycerophosphate/cardiolipin synthase-like enzyme
MRYLYLISTLFVLFLMPDMAHSQMFEDFEEGDKASYAPANIEIETGSWHFNDALIGTLDSDKKNGLRAARIRNGYIRMDFDYPAGLSELSFFAASFSSDSGGSVQVSFSTDQGGTWEELGDNITLTSELTQYTIAGSIDDNVRLRFEKTGGNRINIDDVLISDYIEISDHPSILLRINDLPHENGSTFDFGTNVGTAEAFLQIRNTGIEDLVISSYDISGTEFSVDGNMNITLSYLETAGFELSFESETPGIIEGSITLITNDPENEEFILYLTAETLDTSQPISIADARNLPMGTLVTVAGWVTVAHQFAGPVYFQDETAGIAWYSDELMRQEYLVGAVIGDSLLLTGHTGHFNNLLQIIDEISFEVFPEANAPVEPLEINLEQLNTGNYEGLLVSITDLEFLSTGIFSGGTNYDVIDSSGEGELRIDNFTNIPGTPIPNSEARATGVAGRFGNTQQILPRFTGDIEVLSGPIILTAPPYEVSATSSSIEFEWTTMHAGHSEIRYGLTTDLELGSVIDEDHKTSHSLSIEDLDPATIYKVQLRSAFDADTSATSLYITSTGSPPGTTGDISVFFNKETDHELATFREADQNIHFGNKLIEYIDLAEETAEFAFYNISGSVGYEVAAAILEAHNRGVDIRVIGSGHTGYPNDVLNGLADAGVKAVQSTSEEQMHNKFAIIDAHHSDPAKTHIITSSWNATDDGTLNQYQNMVIIQDVALARAYLEEFNQMWGAESGHFNPVTARFSYDKTVANPSVFWIGEDQTRTELYFSPQGNTEAQINSSLATATANIDIGLNLITRRTISNTMRSRFNEGVNVRGVIGVISGTGSEWEYLNSWADVHHFSQGEFGLLHHKYAIVDGEVGSTNSKVITGSHNWSANANFRNDENTLIIHNSRVANEYIQEFAARYRQAGGEDEFDVSTDIHDPGIRDNQNTLWIQNYPNPFSTHTHIRFELPAEEIVTLVVYDITGRIAARLIDQERMPAGMHEILFEAPDTGNGFYISRLQLESGESVSEKMMLFR